MQSANTIAQPCSHGSRRTDIGKSLSNPILIIQSKNETYTWYSFIESSIKYKKPKAVVSQLQSLMPIHTLVRNISNMFKSSKSFPSPCVMGDESIMVRTSVCRFLLTNALK